VDVVHVVASSTRIAAELRRIYASQDQLGVFQLSAHGNSSEILLEERTGAKAHPMNSDELCKFMGIARPSLLILAACNSFLHAKAVDALGVVPHIVATTVKVDHYVTQHFLCRLYESLAAGDSVATAFATACDAIDDSESFVLLPPPSIALHDAPLLGARPMADYRVRGLDSPLCTLPQLRDVPSFQKCTAAGAVHKVAEAFRTGARVVVVEGSTRGVGASTAALFAARSLSSGVSSIRTFINCPVVWVPSGAAPLLLRVGWALGVLDSPVPAAAAAAAAVSISPASDDATAVILGALRRCPADVKLLLVLDDVCSASNLNCTCLTSLGGHCFATCCSPQAVAIAALLHASPCVNVIAATTLAHCYCDSASSSVCCRDAEGGIGISESMLLAKRQLSEVSGPPSRSRVIGLQGLPTSVVRVNVLNPLPTLLVLWHYFSNLGLRACHGNAFMPRTAEWVWTRLLEDISDTPVESESVAAAVARGTCDVVALMGEHNAVWLPEVLGCSSRLSPSGTLRMPIVPVPASVKREQGEREYLRSHYILPSRFINGLDGNLRAVAMFVAEARDTPLFHLPANLPKLCANRVLHGSAPTAPLCAPPLTRHALMASWLARLGPPHEPALLLGAGRGLLGRHPAAALSSGAESTIPPGNPALKPARSSTTEDPTPPRFARGASTSSSGDDGPCTAGASAVELHFNLACDSGRAEVLLRSQLLGVPSSEPFTAQRCFVLRERTREPGCFAISLWSQPPQRVCHIPLEPRGPGGFRVDVRGQGSREFCSVEHAVRALGPHLPDYAVLPSSGALLDKAALLARLASDARYRGGDRCTCFSFSSHTTPVPS
jgi:hypothetical protein